MVYKTSIYKTETLIHISQSHQNNNNKKALFTNLK